MRKMPWSLLLVAILAAPAFGQQDIEQRKIDFLIAAIADLHDARFVRNGSEFDSLRAAGHLRFKFQHGCARVPTAENFIADCATASSISGVPYRIRFADGHTIEAATFLRDKLAAYPAPARSTPGKPGN